jgi:hypothetical protein
MTTELSCTSIDLEHESVRKTMKDKDGKYWAYGYDPRYQLRSETKWSQKVNGSRQYQYGWLYDANGNRLTHHHDGVPTDYVYGGNNEMLEAGDELLKKPVVWRLSAP